VALVYNGSMRLRRLAPMFVATLVLAPAAPAAAQEPTPLVVVEVATVRAAPDTVMVAGEITRRARSAAIARRRVERRVAAVLGNLDALGVARADVRTSSVSSYRSRRHGRTRYHASTSLEVRTTDLAKVSEILAAFGGASISGPEFSVSDTTAARQEATRIALQRAPVRADAAAAALGLRVVAIRKVDLNAEFGYDTGAQPASGRGTDDGASSGGGGGGGVSIEPGRDEVSVAVAVIYELGP
jgi:uncharacterized protein YggE